MNKYNFSLIKAVQKKSPNYNPTIIYENLPTNINGFIFEYDNNIFVIIDKKLSYNMKKKTIKKIMQLNKKASSTAIELAKLKNKFSNNTKNI